MRSTAFLFIVFFLVSFGQAQDANNLALDATVKDQDGGKLTGVDIVVIQDGALINKVKTRNNGRFDLLLDFDHEYIIEANRPGFVSKRMYVNTNNVPEDEQIWGYEYGGFAIDLFKNIEGVDFSILNKPVAKIYYDPNAQNFTYDKTYTKQIKQQLDALLEDYEKKEKIQEQLLALKDKDYELAIKDAENAFEDGDYLVAKENYLAAASLKPNEPNPKKKLQEIEKKITADANKEDQYMSILASADQLFAEEKFQAALNKYKEASELKPNEEYPKSKLKASEIAAEQKKKEIEAEALLAEKDRKYNEQIEKADTEFTAGNFQNAKTYYQNALGLKNDEAYPKNQIIAADKKIDELKNQQIKDQELVKLTEKYNAQIAKADAAYNSGNLENALSGYELAKKIKSDEDYPDNQIKLIEASQKELAEKAQKAKELELKNKAYEELISEANRLFQTKNYADSKVKFELAVAERPDDTYPKTKIEDIDRLVKEVEEINEAQEELKAEEVAYNMLIESADKSLQTNKLDLAKADYLKAIELRPTELYPKNKLKEIESIEKTQEIESRYIDLITKADEAFKNGNYSEAITQYQNAITIESLDPYPKNQIVEINRIQDENTKQADLANKQAETERIYAELIKVADDFFNSKQYDDAIQKYSAAKNHTENSKYAEDQIAKSQIKKQEQIESETEKQRLAYQESRYRQAIGEADDSFDQKNYESALSSYNLAASINPSKTYANEQIEKISQLMEEERLAIAKSELEEREKAKEAELKQQYEEVIKLADSFMDQEDFLRAKSKYNEANKLDNSQPYALNQIKAIEKILEEMKEARNAEQNKRIRYNDLMKLGDDAVVARNWDEARKAYQEALNIFPSEKVPSARLEEIDQLEVKEKEEANQKLFYNAIKEADELFLAKDLDASLEKYQLALTYKADPHAEARIVKIKELQNIEPETKDEEIKENRVVTEESFKEGNAKVTIRKVVLGEKTHIYKRVVHSWGGKYYFLNDQPISELVWNRDSE